MTEDQQLWIKLHKERFRQMWGIDIQITICVSDRMMETLIDSCCEYYGLFRGQIMGIDRDQEYVRCRRMIYAIGDSYGVSGVRMAKMMQRDHSTGAYTIRAANKKYQDNPKYREEYEKVHEYFISKWSQVNK